MRILIFSICAVISFVAYTSSCGRQSSNFEPSKNISGAQNGSRPEFSLTSNDSYGINAHRPQDQQAHLLFDKVKSAGITWVRLDFNWDDIETQKGVFEWAKTDHAVRSASDRGLKIFANLNRAPKWANGNNVGRIPATNTEDWKNFCRQTAIRYDGNHGQPKIDIFGMWNEPDGSGLGKDGESIDKRVGDYVNLVLVPGSEAIRSVRADAKVAGPDLASETEFLNKMFGKAKTSLDIVTVHKYSDNASGVTDYMEKVKSIMVAQGIFDQKPLWLTETGWTTTVDNCWFQPVNDDTQAKKYTELLGRIKDRPWINKVYFYELIDDDHPGACQWGILRSNMSEKPAYQAYKKFIAANQTGSTNSWIQVNNPNSNGNDFGQLIGSQIGGIFARSSAVRSFVNSNWKRSLRRTESFSFSGQVSLANVNFDGSFYLGYTDKNDPSAPLSLIGFVFKEPAGSATGEFRVSATIQHSNGQRIDSPTVLLSQNTTFPFSAKWTGRSDGSGTLTGTIGTKSFNVSQGPGDESLNAFGVGVGLDTSTLADRKTGKSIFNNLQFTIP
jgi:hypothetical protein